MSSYILPFRGWLYAIAAIVVFELTIAILAPSSPFDRTNFLQFSFARPEPEQRLVVFHKLRAFANASPDIVQVGDSSGFYGIEPAVVTKHLPPGINYLNLSCCANLGFRGYYNILEFMARHNPSIKYMVLYITPYTMPGPDLWDADGANLWGPPGMEVFGGAVHDEFLSAFNPRHLPSMGYRREVSNAIYYGAPILQRLRESSSYAVGSVDFLRDLTGSQVYRDFLDTYQRTKGWMPEVDQRRGVYASVCDIPLPTFFDWKRFGHRTYLETIFDEFSALAHRHNAKLVIAFQPAACLVGPQNEKARKLVETYKTNHPEIEIPFPLIETWPVDLFSVPAHIRKEYTDMVGHRLGTALGALVEQDLKQSREGRP